jgi:chemotaxis signal transduction protein
VADTGEAQFMCALVGDHRLVFDLRTLLSIEGKAVVEHEAILGPVNLRDWLGVPRESGGSEESLLILGESAVYRFVVDRVVRLERSELPRIHAIPDVLHPVAGPLCIRGIVELDDGLAYLVDPKPLALAASSGIAS